METKAIEKEGKSRRLKHGSYGMVSLCIVLAVVVLVNMAIGMIPAAYTKLSHSDLYTISDTSRDILGNLAEDVTIYTVIEDGSEDEIVDNYLEKYASLTSHIALKTIDPAINPTFVSKVTDESLDVTLPTLVVMNKDNGRFRVIYYNDIYYDSLGWTYEEFCYYNNLAKYGYDVGFQNSASFSLENKLSSAVDYVTGGEKPMVYYTTGRGELEPDTVVRGLIEDENIDLSELVLSSVTEVPENAKAILMIAPTSDYTEEEINLLKQYVERGGQVLLFSRDFSVSLPNLNGFSADMGLERGEGLVCENDTAHRYAGAQGVYPFYIFPVVEDSVFSERLKDSVNLLVTMAHPIRLLDTGDPSNTLTSLLSTTGKGYLKPVDTEQAAYEEGDEVGAFCLAAMSEKMNTDGSVGRLVFFSSVDMASGSYTGYYANTTYLVAVMDVLCDKESSVVIGSRSLEIEPLTVSEKSADVWGMILIILLPLFFLGYGFAVWYRRNKV